MIESHPRPDHECITITCEDSESRVRVHLHREVSGNDPRLRQLEVLSNTETVLALDLVERDEEMECDI